MNASTHGHVYRCQHTQLAASGLADESPACGGGGGSLADESPNLWRHVSLRASLGHAVARRGSAYGMLGSIGLLVTQNFVTMEKKSAHLCAADLRPAVRPKEIGRASCRERV